ncbi:MAG: hypothetical protein FJ000_03385, partial [Actinobacteria bacterium]|nr:hypothetical protein [Actinomycetota bacterium]
SAGGRQMWLRTYGQAEGVDADVRAIAVDPRGDLIVAGQITDAAGSDILAVKYSSTGSRRWVRHYQGSGLGNDWSSDVAVDGRGAVYVVGDSPGVGPGTDYVVVKWSSGGAYRWEFRYTGPGGESQSSAIAVDDTRASYVTGFSRGAAGDFDSVTLKVDATGHLVKAKRWAGPAGLTDGGRQIVADGRAVYVTAQTTTPPGDDIVLIKYDLRMRQRWVRTWDGPGGSDDYCESLLALGIGDLRLAGVTLEPDGTHCRALLMRWNGRGECLWARTCLLSGKTFSWFQGAAADAAGTTWCVGWQAGDTGGMDVLVARYRPSGSRRWARVWSGPGDDNDEARAVCLAGSSGLYVGGGATQAGTAIDPVLLKYRR